MTSIVELSMPASVGWKTDRTDTRLVSQCSHPDIRELSMSEATLHHVMWWSVKNCASSSGKPTPRCSVLLGKATAHSRCSSAQQRECMCPRPPRGARRGTGCCHREVSMDTSTHAFADPCEVTTYMMLQRVLQNHCT